jgi:hypothetical protein
MTLRRIPVGTEADTAALFDWLARRCKEASASKGFWDAPRNKGEMIALMHSELSEMLEGVRAPCPDKHCPEFTSEEIELADLFIRGFDYAGGFQLRLGEAILAKLRFNASRPHMHGKAF